MPSHCWNPGRASNWGTSRTTGRRSWHDGRSGSRNPFPICLPPRCPADTEESKWKFDELYEYLSGDEGLAGKPSQGALVFEKATCIKCHRYGDRGEAIGPDLTSLTKRFTRKEILQSILYPSHVISSQYAAKNLLLMDGRQLAGIVAPGASGEKTVLTSEGEKISIPEKDIDEITPSTVSAMPDGLLKELTMEDIADLFAYISNDPVQALAERPANDSEENTGPEEIETASTLRSCTILGASGRWHGNSTSEARSTRSTASNAHGT